MCGGPTLLRVSLVSQTLIENQKKVWSHYVRVVVTIPRSWRDQSGSLIFTWCHVSKSHFCVLWQWLVSVILNLLMALNYPTTLSKGLGLNTFHNHNCPKVMWPDHLLLFNEGLARGSLSEEAQATGSVIAGCSENPQKSMELYHRKTNRCGKCHLQWAQF